MTTLPLQDYRDIIRRDVELPALDMLLRYIESRWAQNENQLMRLVWEPGYRLSPIPVIVF